MKVVILAGGKGARFSEETHIKPKPLIEIGGRPILWHIMKIYSAHGFNEFVICLGYKGYLIKEYFANYFLHQSDLTIDLKTNVLRYYNQKSEPWIITLIDTGEETLTGGRVKRAKPYIGDEPFLLTYGDGVGDIDVTALVQSHQQSGKSVTVTGVQPLGRFGAMSVDSQNAVTAFNEKPQGDGHWINGGFFVCEPSVFDLIDDDKTIWERAPMEAVSANGQLNAYLHRGFWHPMDKQHDQKILTEMVESGTAAWMRGWK